MTGVQTCALPIYELLTLEATGDYAGTKEWMARLGVIRPEVQAGLDHLKSLPTDIEPIFVTADSVAGGRSPGAGMMPK